MAERNRRQHQTFEKDWSGQKQTGIGRAWNGTAEDPEHLHLSLLTHRCWKEDEYTWLYDKTWLPLIFCMEWETAQGESTGPHGASLCRSSQPISHWRAAAAQSLHALQCTDARSLGIAGIFGHSSTPRICFLTFEMAFPFERFGKLFEKKKHLETFLKGQNQNKHLENIEFAHPVWNVHFLWICCAYIYFFPGLQYFFFSGQKRMSDLDSSCGAGRTSPSQPFCLCIIHMRNGPLDCKPVGQFASKKETTTRVEKDVENKSYCLMW